ncbi:MAG: hypothetical protein DWQ06_10380 [Calditrichaeota bacterium]|nr:MAG: hypothetical protein DWQ06_10380 [Calditrichota bacterium]
MFCAKTLVAKVRRKNIRSSFFIQKIWLFIIEAKMLKVNFQKGKQIFGKLNFYEICFVLSFNKFFLRRTKKELCKELL